MVLKIKQKKLQQKDLILARGSIEHINLKELENFYKKIDLHQNEKKHDSWELILQRKRKEIQKIIARIFPKNFEVSIIEYTHNFFILKIKIPETHYEIFLEFTKDNYYLHLGSYELQKECELLAKITARAYLYMRSEASSLKDITKNLNKEKTALGRERIIKATLSELKNLVISAAASLSIDFDDQNYLVDITFDDETSEVSITATLKNGEKIFISTQRINNHSAEYELERDLEKSFDFNSLKLELEKVHELTQNLDFAKAQNLFIQLIAFLFQCFSIGTLKQEEKTKILLNIFGNENPKYTILDEDLKPLPEALMTVNIVYELAIQQSRGLHIVRKTFYSKHRKKNFKYRLNF